MIVEVNWKDPQAIVDRMRADGWTAEPLLVERLLEHFGFEEVGALPTIHAHAVVMWAHKARDRHPELLPYRFVVHHVQPLTRVALEPILRGLMEAAARARACGAGAPVVRF